MRRWKKMDYTDELKIGRYEKGGNFRSGNGRLMYMNGQNIENLATGSEGYLNPQRNIPPPFEDFYYLYPLPTNEIVLTNGAIEQNPGWDTE